MPISPCAPGMACTISIKRQWGRRYSWTPETWRCLWQMLRRRPQRRTQAGRGGHVVLNQVWLTGRRPGTGFLVATGCFLQKPLCFEVLGQHIVLAADPACSLFVFPPNDEVEATVGAVDQPTANGHQLAASRRCLFSTCSTCTFLKNRKKRADV